MRGGKNHTARLTDTQAASACAWVLDGMSISQAAAHFGVPYDVIYNIVKGYTYIRATNPIRRKHASNRKRPFCD